MFVTPAYAEETPAATAPAGQDAAATAAHGTTPAAGETHTETGVAHEAGHGSGVFPPFDTTTFPSQILWLVITFGLFFMLMKKVIVPRVGTIIDNRQDRISQDLDQASRLKAEADAAVETYERELAAARAKGNEIASAARDAAKVKADAERAAVEADVSAKLAAAEARIADIKAKAFADVGTIAEETAGTVVEQLLGKQVPPGDVAAAVAAAKQEA